MPVNLKAAGLLFLAYVRWTVTTAIQAHGEFGKFMTPLLGVGGLVQAVALRSLFGARRAAWVVVAFMALFVLWDCLSVHHLGTELIPRYGPTLVPPPGAG